MSAPLDVLAVMDDRIGRFDVHGNFSQDDELCDARAAVAELVEAARDAEGRMTLLLALGRGKMLDAVAAQNLRAALAKFGGAVNRS